MIKIITDKCIGCTACVKVCPFSAISMVSKKAVIDYHTCTLCKACVPSCKFSAIIYEEEKSAAPHKQDTSGYSGVWVYGELTRDYKPASVSLELLTKARDLAKDLKTYTAVVVIGPSAAKQHLDVLKEYGADKIFFVHNEHYKHYLSEVFSEAFFQVVKKHKPDIILAGATTIGRSLMPRLAVQLQTGLTADCTELHIDPKERLLIQTRPAFGGNIMACIITRNTKPQMATVRHRVMKASAHKNPKCEIIEEKTTPSKTGVEFIKFLKEETSKVNIAEANIIISGGRGIGAKENFALIEQFAESLNAAVGASRAAVDSGWIPYSHQVGQTGTTVSPKIYIACGISGQIQHLVGMQSSDIIVAINKDPDAPIFKVADYGIVGDLFKVIPALIKRFKAQKS